jgi:hypothetical protein
VHRHQRYLQEHAESQQCKWQLARIPGSSTRTGLRVSCRAKNVSHTKHVSVSVSCSRGDQSVAVSETKNENAHMSAFPVVTNIFRITCLNVTVSRSVLLFLLWRKRKEEFLVPIGPIFTGQAVKE